MPNGTKSDSGPMIFGILVKGGMWGAVGVGVAGLAQVAVGLAEISGNPPPWVQDVLHGGVWVGAAIALSSIAYHANRTTQMIVTTQAENKIQSPGLIAASADPAVQREITKQLNGGEKKADS